MITRMTEGARGERCYRPRFSRLAPLSLARECTLLTKSKEKEGLSVIDNVHSGFFFLSCFRAAHRYQVKMEMLLQYPRRQMKLSLLQVGNC